ncbi:hypothetical protein [Anaerotardibacter muris]|uniref:hypothetical protein n=1 Tax=Anaerotardibacter muris TaxID=2941505 RepID=UPI00203CC0D3|nr:hypothetical protein [Anaerotardibacter muris]
MDWVYVTVSALLSLIAAIVTALVSDRLSSRRALEERYKTKSIEAYDECMQCVDTLLANASVLFTDSFRIELSKAYNHVSVYGAISVVEKVNHLLEFVTRNKENLEIECLRIEEKYHTTELVVDPETNESIEVDRLTIDPEELEKIIEQKSKQLLPSSTELRSKTDPVLNAIKTASSSLRISRKAA